MRFVFCFGGFIFNILPHPREKGARGKRLYFSEWDCGLVVFIIMSPQMSNYATAYAYPYITAIASATLIHVIMVWLVTPKL